jgi:glycosyltransferase involved in cell wall biosynthesis
MDIHKKMFSKKLSILFVCRGPFGYQGGAASYMFPKVLAENGHNVRVVSFSDRYGETDKVINHQYNSKFEIDEYSEKSFFERLKIIRKNLIIHKPDIVHVFTIPKYFLLPVLCKLFGCIQPRWLIDIRSPPIDAKPLTKKKLKKIKKKLGFFPQLGFDVITSPVLSSAHENFGKVVKPLYEVPFGVDLSLVKKKNWDQRQKEETVKKFIYIGSLSRQRKIETLIKAINIVKKKYEKKFQVDFYGVGNFIEALETMIDEMDLKDIVHFHGVIPQQQLFKTLCGYDIGIGYVPYEQYMGSPALKVLEYMAANLLVIASDTEGIKKQVTHKLNGILFQNTPESISETMLDVLENDFPFRIIEKGYLHALKNSWDIIVNNRLMIVYKDLMG